MLPDIKSDEILYTALTDAVEIAPYLKNRVNNGGLAIPEAIEQDRFFQQIGDICDKASYETMEVKRARYKLGSLQVLMTLASSNEHSGKQTFWWNVNRYANTEEIENFLMENKVMITGNPKKMCLKLFT